MGQNFLLAGAVDTKRERRSYVKAIINILVSILGQNLSFWVLVLDKPFEMGTYKISPLGHTK